MSAPLQHGALIDGTLIGDLAGVLEGASSMMMARSMQFELPVLCAAKLLNNRTNSLRAPTFCASRQYSSALGPAL
ncbi:MAG TPA: hypothetical protein VKX49_27445 [Bryobacteraceae bacterium]|nr:hypothetical protein [Bryobacteraceae bacterium]